MVIENCYLIYENDFEQQNWIDWIKNHITLAPPPHRFEGQISILTDRMNFIGTDKYLNESCEFDIDKNSITQIFYGYDQIFNKFQTRGFGLSYAPIRLKLENESDEIDYVYIVSNFNGVTSTNQDLFEFLKTWLE